MNIIRYVSASTYIYSCQVYNIESTAHTHKTVEWSTDWQRFVKPSNVLKEGRQRTSMAAHKRAMSPTDASERANLSPLLEYYV